MDSLLKQLNKRNCRPDQNSANASKNSPPTWELPPPPPSLYRDSNILPTQLTTLSPHSSVGQALATTSSAALALDGNKTLLTDAAPEHQPTPEITSSINPPNTSNPAKYCFYSYLIREEIDSAEVSTASRSHRSELGLKSLARRTEIGGGAGNDMATHATGVKSGGRIARSINICTHLYRPPY